MKTYDSVSSSLGATETFRFKDDDDFEEEIWLEVFFAYSEKIDIPESLIFLF